MTIRCAACPLRKLPQFEGITAPELQFLQSFKKGELQVTKGTPLLLEGSSSPQLFTALDGLAIRFKTLPDGERQVINFVFPGDFLGLQAGVMKEMQHSVEAVTDMTLCVFDRSQLWKLFQASPARGFDLTWLAAIEEHMVAEALTSVGQQPALARIAWAMAKLFERARSSGLAEGDAAKLPFRQQDVADAMGLSLVHTNKTLATLRRRKIASWQDGWLRILDKDKLHEIGGIVPDAPTVRPLI